MNSRKRILLTLGILALMATAVSAGSFALFTTSTAVPNELFSTGTLSIGASPASAIASLSNMLPGDTVTGLETLSNTGTEDLTSYQLVTSVTAGTPTNPNLLTSDATNGLHLWIQRCTVAYTGTGAAATCSGGSASDVVGTSASPVAILNTSSLSSNAFCTANVAMTAAVRTARGTTCDPAITGGNDYLKVRVSLPSAAGNTFQTLSTTLSFTFSGNQASGANF
jgi:spore coat-associated protein N